jgi:DNA-binding XRE family transcriptional regulator
MAFYWSYELATVAGGSMTSKTTTKIVKHRKRIIGYVTVTKEIKVAELPYVRFGEAVRELRKAKKMNQTELSKLVKKSRASVTNIEIGRQRVLLGDVFAFAKALRVAPDELFSMVDLHV